MPIVDYNRIYKVRSQERRPVLNPVNVPDAAGARMRAGAPALDAALGIARDRARERGLRDRDRWAAIGNLVGVGAKAGAAYADALERRDEADLSAMRAAWTNHMNAGAEEAWRRKYSRAGNGVEADGPLRAIIDLDRSFDETGYFTGARDGVRERFQKWRAGARQTYVAKGERLQAEAGEAFRQQAYVADCAAREDEIARLYNPEDGEEYALKSETTADFEVGTKFMELGLGDFTGEGGAFRFRDDVPPEAPERAEFARLCKEKWRQFDLRRFKHWCAMVASDDSPQGDPGLVEQIRKEIAKADWYTPEERDGMRQLLSAAEDSRRQNMRKSDARLDEELAGTLYAAAWGETDDDRNLAVTELRSAAPRYLLDSSRAAAMERTRRIVAANEVRRVKALYGEAFVDVSGIDGMRDALTGFQEATKNLETEEGRDAAERMIAEGARAVSGAEKAAVDRFMSVAEFGWAPARTQDGQVTQMRLTPPQILDAYMEVAQFLTPEQSEKASGYVRKLISDNGMDVPTESEVRQTFLALGLDANFLDEEVLGDRPLVARSQAPGGWAVNKGRFDFFDSPAPGARDGVAMLNGERQAIRLETLQLVMSALREYKAQQRLAKGGGEPLSAFLDGLRNRAAPLTDRSVYIEAMRARELYSDRFRVFHQPEFLLPDRESEPSDKPTETQAK